MNDNVRSILAQGTVDAKAAQYWNTPVTRAEVQKAFDEYTAAFTNLHAQVIKLEFAVSYLVERAGVTPDEVSAYMQRKLDKLKLAADKPTVVK